MFIFPAPSPAAHGRCLADGGSTAACLLMGDFIARQAGFSLGICAESQPDPGVGCDSKGCSRGQPRWWLCCCQGAEILLGKVQPICRAPERCRARSGCATDILCSAAVATGHRGVGSEPGEWMGQTTVLWGTQEFLDEPAWP